MDHSLEWFSTNKHVSRKTEVCVEGLHSKRKCTEANKNLNTLLKTMFPIQKSHHAEITKIHPASVLTPRNTTIKGQVILCEASTRFMGRHKHCAARSGKSSSRKRAAFRATLGSVKCGSHSNAEKLKRPKGRRCSLGHRKSF